MWVIWCWRRVVRRVSWRFDGGDGWDVSWLMESDGRFMYSKYWVSWSFVKVGRSEGCMVVFGDDEVDVVNKIIE